MQQCSRRIRGCGRSGADGTAEPALVKTRLTLVMVALCSNVSLADLVSEEAGACRGLAAGGACSLPDGSEGQCVAKMVSRPVSSTGIPPGVKQIEELTCTSTVAVPSAKVFSRLILFAAMALIIFSLSAWMRRRQLHVA